MTNQTATSAERDAAQLLPREAQAPGLDEHEQHQRADALGHAIDGDVDERLGLQLDVERQRQEQDLARGLVDGVAERAIDDAAERRRPQRVVGEDDARHHAEVDRQHHQREADAEQAMNAAGEKDLDDERRRPRSRSGRRRETPSIESVCAAALELLRSPCSTAGRGWRRPARRTLMTTAIS